MSLCIILLDTGPSMWSWKNGAGVRRSGEVYAWPTLHLLTVSTNAITVFSLLLQNQKCTKFGYFKTTDSVKQLFEHFLSLEWCELIFNISSDLELLHLSFAATNAYYGGKDIPKNVTNIVFPNGSIDPWHALGVTESISESLIAIFIKGTAHCANMYPPRDNDPPALTAAREKITQQIGLWLSK